MDVPLTAADCTAVRRSITRVKSDQFYITHQTTKGHMAIYEGRPSTDWDKNKELGIDVPVISHESGQRCIYPNFKEIP